MSDGVSEVITVRLTLFEFDGMKKTVLTYESDDFENPQGYIDPFLLQRKIWGQTDNFLFCLKHIKHGVAEFYPLAVVRTQNIQEVMKHWGFRLVKQCVHQAQTYTGKGRRV